MGLEKAKAGDCVFFMISKRNMDFFKSVQSLLGEKVGHIAIFHSLNDDGTMKCLESNFAGVRWVNVEKNVDIKIGRFNVIKSNEEQTKRSIENHYKSIKNKRYGFGGLLDIGFNLFLKKITFGRWKKRKFLKEKQDPDHCSELYIEWLNKHTGRKNFDDDMTSPYNLYVNSQIIVE